MMKDKELRRIMYESFEEIAQALEKLDKRVGDDSGFAFPVLWKRPWQELKKCKCDY